MEVLEERDGRSKGCAVVEFKNREGATKCIENMHRTELRDRLIIAKEIRVRIFARKFGSGFLDKFKIVEFCTHSEKSEILVRLLIYQSIELFSSKFLLILVQGIHKKISFESKFQIGFIRPRGFFPSDLGKERFAFFNKIYFKFFTRIFGDPDLGFSKQKSYNFMQILKAIRYLNPRFQ